MMLVAAFAARQVMALVRHAMKRVTASSATRCDAAGAGGAA